MSTLAVRTDERVKQVQFTDDTISVDLMDGRTIIVPLVWYPRLLKATQEQREKWEICGGGYGIHWEEIDEDLSTEGMYAALLLRMLQFKSGLRMKSLSD